MKPKKNPEFIMQRMKRATRGQLGIIKSHIETVENKTIPLYEVMERLVSREIVQIKSNSDSRSNI